MNYYLTCCRSGREGKTIFMGHSCAASPTGEIIASTDSLEEEVITAELRDDEIYKTRASGTSVGFAERKPNLYTIITEPLAPPFFNSESTPASATPEIESKRQSEE